MNLTIKTPEFVTDLMKLWLLQYKVSQQDTITQLGIFHWDFSHNRRNPNKPRRIPKIDFYEVLKEETFKRNIYFLEIDDTTLHVFESSGLALAGQSRVVEYALEHEIFIKKKVVLNMIR
jgi:hypothetical protein